MAAKAAALAAAILEARAATRPGCSASTGGLPVTTPPQATVLHATAAPQAAPQALTQAAPQAPPQAFPQAASQAAWAHAPPQASLLAASQAFPFPRAAARAVLAQAPPQAAAQASPQAASRGPAPQQYAPAVRVGAPQAAPQAHPQALPQAAPLAVSEAAALPHALAVRVGLLGLASAFPPPENTYTQVRDQGHVH